MSIRDHITVQTSEVAPSEPAPMIETPAIDLTVESNADQITESNSEQATTIEDSNETGQSNVETDIDVKENITKEDRKALGNKVEKKINKLTKAKAQANERADDAMKRLQQAEATIARLKNQNTDVESMSFDERIKHGVDSQLAEQHANNAKANAQQDLQNSGSEVWSSKLESAQAKYSDFAEKVGGSDIPMKPDVAQAIKESDFGGDMLYEIANTPGLGDELYRASPLRAAVLLQSLEQKIGSSDSVLTNAQPAVNIAATPTPAATNAPRAATNLAQMSMTDFMAHKAKQRENNSRR